MSLAAIQDNLVKTSLVQHTQSRVDDVSRGQQIAQTAAQREHDRQEDQVVITLRETEQKNIRADEEREKEEQRKKRKREKEAEDKDQESPAEGGASGGQSTPGTRAVMRRINIVI